MSRHPRAWARALEAHFLAHPPISASARRLPTAARPGRAHLGISDRKRSRGTVALTGLMDYLGGTPMGGRTREEIVDRLMEQAAEAAALRLDKKAVALIERVLSVAGPARESLSEIRALLHKNGIKLEAPLLVEAQAW